MKKLVMVVLVSACLAAQAVAGLQRVVVIKVTDGRAETAPLAKLLAEGWRVVNSVPVVDSSGFGIGKPRQGFTSEIVYVIEKQ
jgi:hypothetical protein